MTAGSALDQMNFNSINTQEGLTNGKVYLLPAAVDRGITVYVDVECDVLMPGVLDKRKLIIVSNTRCNLPTLNAL